MLPETDAVINRPFSLTLELNKHTKASELTK